MNKIIKSSSEAIQGSVFALVRHGEYEQPPGVPSAHLPHPLTAKGRAQAQATATALAEFARCHELSLVRVDCSRMLRAWQSATLIAEALRQPPPLEVEALAERSLGAVANLSVKRIEAIIDSDPRFAVPPTNWKRDPDYRVPFQGAETLMEAGSRLACYLQDSADRLRTKRGLVVCVGHGGSFRHAAHQLGVLSRDQVARVSMHHGQPVYLEHRARADELQRIEYRWTHVAGKWKARTTDPSID